MILNILKTIFYLRVSNIGQDLEKIKPLLRDLQITQPKAPRSVS